MPENSDVSVWIEQMELCEQVLEDLCRANHLNRIQNNDEKTTSASGEERKRRSHKAKKKGTIRRNGKQTKDRAIRVRDSKHAEMPKKQKKSHSAIQQNDTENQAPTVARPERQPTSPNSKGVLSICLEGQPTTAPKIPIVIFPKSPNSFSATHNSNLLPFNRHFVLWGRAAEGRQESPSLRGKEWNNNNNKMRCEKESFLSSFSLLNHPTTTFFFVLICCSVVCLPHTCQLLREDVQTLRGQVVDTHAKRSLSGKFPSSLLP